MLSRRRFIKSSAVVSLTGIGFASLLEACGSAGTSAPAVSAPAQSIDDLLSAAKQEGTLSWYSTAALPATQGLNDAFQKKYGLQATFFQGNSIAVATRVQTEALANKLGADVIVMDTPVMPFLVPYLTAWNPPARDPISAVYKEPTFTQIRVYVGAVGWNTKNVKGADVPKDWPDFGDPKWKGRLGLVDPSSTVIAGMWFDMVSHLYGDPYLQKVAANKPRLYTTGVALAQAIAAGEIDLGMVYDYSIFQLKGQGAPFDGVVPPETLATGSDIGVFAAAAHPNLGKLFYNFACSSEGQTALNTSGNSIATYPGLKIANADSLSDLKKIYPTDIAKLQASMPAIQSQFNKLFKQ